MKYFIVLFIIIKPILILIGLSLIINEFKTKQTSSFYFGFMLGLSLCLLILMLLADNYMQAFFKELKDNNNYEKRDKKLPTKIKTIYDKKN
jgi:hypothetical protein